MEKTPPGQGSPFSAVWEEGNGDINYEEREHLLLSNQISVGKEKEKQTREQVGL